MASLISFFLLLAVTCTAVNCHSDYHDYSEEVQDYPNPSHDAVDILDQPYIADLDGCAGVIVNEWWILTAAHCAYDRFTGAKKPYLVARVGSHRSDKGRKYAVAFAVEHPKFDMYNSLHFDFLLLKLNRSLSFGPWVRPARLAGAHDRDLTTGVVGEAVGFGYSDGENHQDQDYLPKRLMKQKVRVISTEDCRARFRDIDLHGVGMCATSGRNPCDESGGPLLIEGKVVAVTAAVTEHACTSSDPLVFASLPLVRGWIRHHTRLRSSALHTSTRRYTTQWITERTTGHPVVEY